MKKYGDYDNVTKDSTTIYDIIDRQSDSLLFECIAERFANARNQFNLSDYITKRVMDAKLDALKAELIERI